MSATRSAVRRAVKDFLTPTKWSLTTAAASGAAAAMQNYYASRDETRTKMYEDSINNLKGRDTGEGMTILDNLQLKKEELGLKIEKFRTKYPKTSTLINALAGAGVGYTIGKGGVKLAADPTPILLMLQKYAHDTHRRDVAEMSFNEIEAVLDKYASDFPYHLLTPHAGPVEERAQGLHEHYQQAPKEPSIGRAVAQGAVPALAGTGVGALTAHLMDLPLNDPKTWAGLAIPAGVLGTVAGVKAYREDKSRTDANQELSEYTPAEMTALLEQAHARNPAAVRAILKSASIYTPGEAFRGTGTNLIAMYGDDVLRAGARMRNQAITPQEPQKEKSTWQKIKPFVLPTAALGLGLYGGYKGRQWLTQRRGDTDKIRYVTSKLHNVHPDEAISAYTKLTPDEKEIIREVSLKAPIHELENMSPAQLRTRGIANNIFGLDKIQAEGMEGIADAANKQRAFNQATGGVPAANAERVARGMERIKVGSANLDEAHEEPGFFRRNWKVLASIGVPLGMLGGAHLLSKYRHGQEIAQEMKNLANEKHIEDMISKGKDLFSANTVPVG